MAVIEQLIAAGFTARQAKSLAYEVSYMDSGAVANPPTIVGPCCFVNTLAAANNGIKIPLLDEMPTGTVIIQNLSGVNVLNVALTTPDVLGGALVGTSFNCAAAQYRLLFGVKDTANSRNVWFLY